MKYLLKSTVSGEFELDRGPRPSGYAKLSLQVQPDSRKNKIHIEISESFKWTSRPADYIEKYASDEVKKWTEKAIPDIVIGIHEGIEEALLNTFKQPIKGVTVILEAVTIDYTYSTIVVFRVAARTLVKQLLNQAYDDNLII